MKIAKFEFEKLDEADVCVVLWLSERYPKTLPEVLKNLVKRYSSKGIALDEQRLLKEFSPEGALRT